MNPLEQVRNGFFGGPTPTAASGLNQGQQKIPEPTPVKLATSPDKPVFTHDASEHELLGKLVTLLGQKESYGSFNILHQTANAQEVAFSFPAGKLVYFRNDGAADLLLTFNDRHTDNPAECFTVTPGQTLPALPLRISYLVVRSTNSAPQAFTAFGVED